MGMFVHFPSWWETMGSQNALGNVAENERLWETTEWQQMSDEAFAGKQWSLRYCCVHTRSGSGCAASVICKVHSFRLLLSTAVHLLTYLSFTCRGMYCVPEHACLFFYMQGTLYVHLLFFWLILEEGLTSFRSGFKLSSDLCGGL